MRAVQVVELTGPEHLEVREVPEPTPGPEDVLVEVHAIGVSFPDLLLSRGEYQLKPEPPFTLGVDFAGTVVSGPGFEPGQRVAGVGRLRQRRRADRVSQGLGVPAARRALLRRGRGAADELPHRAVRAGRARPAGGRRDRSRARCRRRSGDGDDPGRQGVRRPHHRGREHRREGRDGPQRRAPTRWSCSTGSRTPSPR